MPMAGLGSRTRSFSQDPKPFISLFGIPLFRFALSGLPLERCSKLTFVLNEKDRKFFDETGKFLFENFVPKNLHSSVVFTSMTSGQAETVDIALSSDDLSRPLLIASCDTMVTKDFPEDVSRWDGLLGTFWSDNPAMSYVRLEEGIVAETAEKRVISSNASSGLYYFRKAADFRRAYRESTFQGERFVAPLYNKLIGKESRIGIWRHSSVTPLGTTKELKDFVTSAKPDLIRTVSEA
jgi:UDP-N-acetylglucosamine diphosphorylase / glucose-1-phosphate thymidylyltransferase / UDP-N-acetylgalactosamine diphosphorylase / glucosamine-1-phosphate N-acetyltransferase / galactosamine-1-phosphate N-acetyltransferase